MFLKGAIASGLVAKSAVEDDVFVVQYRTSTEKVAIEWYSRDLRFSAVFCSCSSRRSISIEAVMSTEVLSRSKESEVQFYLDRSKESMLALLRSIIGNPRLTEVEQFKYLYDIAQHHGAIAELIANKLCEGEQKGLQLAAEAIARSKESTH